MNRVLNSNKQRELKLAQRAFDRMKRNAQDGHGKINYATHLVSLRMQQNFGVKILARYQKNRLKAVRKAFESWKLRSQAATLVQKLQKTLKEEVGKKKKANESLIKAL